MQYNQKYGTCELIYLRTLISFGDMRLLSSKRNENFVSKSKFE